MNYPSKIVLAILAGTLASAPALSQQIIVNPSEHPKEQFVNDTTKDLDRQLERATRFNPWNSGGIVKVRFNVGPDGTAENVSLYRRSGDPVADRVAMRAVNLMHELPPLPASIRADQVIQANIILANSERHLQILTNRLAREEAIRIASAEPGDHPVIALNLVGGFES